jgi:hypothetical protein
MKMNRPLVFSMICVSVAVTAYAQDNPDRQRDSRDRNGNNGDTYAESIPAGTRIRVRTDQTIDVRDRSDGRVFTGTMAEEVTSADGRVRIPRGARAELIVQNVRENEMAIDLESVNINGRRYMVAAETYDSSRRTGLGANKRTGEYVGGGAVFGTIIGAIAGGGKGAAIGALAGGAAGGGAEVLTKGQAVRIPAETVLEFRLEQPLQIAGGRYLQDNGYDRDGVHYHNDYYHREREPHQ